MRILRSVSLLALVTAAAASHAGLLIDTTGGSNVAFSDIDDGSALRSLGGTFSLYGADYSSLYVQVDGFLSAADGHSLLSDRGVGTLANLAGSPVVAGLYDDLYLRAANGNGVVDAFGSGYYAATFDLNGYRNGSVGRDSAFQIALFNAAGTFQGVSVQAGDVVLSYDKLNHEIGNNTFSVGVAQNRANATGAFGGDGQFGSFGAFTAGFDPTTQALLFRYDPTNNSYVQSVVTLGTTSAVPGPVAALPFALMALRRRKRA